MRRLLLVALLLLVAVHAYRSIVGSPQFALREAAAAYRAQDLEAFRRVVDTDALSQSLVDGVARALESDASGDRSQQGTVVAVRMLRAGRTGIALQIREGMEEVVRLGPDAPSRRPFGLEVADYWNGVFGEDSQYDGVAYVRTHGRTSHVGLRFEGRRAATLDLILTDGPYGWKLTAIGNLDTLLVQSGMISRFSAQVIDANREAILKDSAAQGARS